MTPRFFAPSPLAVGLDLALAASAAHHATQVLRLKRGDAVTVFDGGGGEYGAEILSSSSRGVDLRLMEHRAVERESPLQVTLAQALIASDRMDYVIQKAVELGAAAIAPIASARCVTRLEAGRAERRIDHWRQIAIAACEQCGRNRIPAVHAPQKLDAWLRRSPNADCRLLLSPAQGEALARMPVPASSIAVLVGPEGGLTPDEETSALAAGFRAVRLGPRVLRTETAGPAMLAAVNALWGDWR